MNLTATSKYTSYILIVNRGFSQPEGISQPAGNTLKCLVRTVKNIYITNLLWNNVSYNFREIYTRYGNIKTEIHRFSYQLIKIILVLKI